jgi:hypothetical protein
MRKFIPAAVAAAAVFASVSPASATDWNHRDHEHYRGYYSHGYSEASIRDRCRDEYWRARRVGHTGGWNREQYVERCVDRNVAAVARSNGRHYHRSGWR